MSSDNDDFLSGFNFEENEQKNVGTVMSGRQLTSDDKAFLEGLLHDDDEELLKEYLTPKYDWNPQQQEKNYLTGNDV